MIRRALAAFRLQNLQLPQKLCHFVNLENSQPATMRLAHRLLMATPASIGSKSSLSEALALLPPLQLYRRILRVHRKLDPEMRVLGDSYVKKEFRAHRTAENPLHIVRPLCLLVYTSRGKNGDWSGKKKVVLRGRN